jgi:hypothetical protein
MGASLAPGWLGRFYSYFVFKSLFTTGQCLVNNNILAPKMGALQIGLNKQSLLENN